MGAIENGLMPIAKGVEIDRTEKNPTKQKPFQTNKLIVDSKLSVFRVTQKCTKENV